MPLLDSIPTKHDANLADHACLCLYIQLSQGSPSSRPVACGPKSMPVAPLPSHTDTLLTLRGSGTVGLGCAKLQDDSSTSCGTGVPRRDRVLKLATCGAGCHADTCTTKCMSCLLQTHADARAVEHRPHARLVPAPTLPRLAAAGATGTHLEVGQAQQQLPRVCQLPAAVQLDEEVVVHFYSAGRHHQAVQRLQQRGSGLLIAGEPWLLKAG